MIRLSIMPTDGRTHFAPGEELRGVATWNIGGSTVAALRLRMFWFTSGKGTTNTQVVQTINVPSPQSEGSSAFSFTLPQSPYSFSGKLISLQWVIELAPPPREEAARFEFTMGPGTQEVNLYAHLLDED